MVCRTVSWTPGLLGVAEEPLEDGQRAVGAERQDEVRREVVGIDVQHQVRIDPVVLARRSRLRRIASQPSGVLARPDRRVLQRPAAARLGRVARVVDLLHEPGVDDRDVVPLEIVVDVDLPVAVELPVLPGGEPHLRQPARVEPRRQVLQRLEEGGAPGSRLTKTSPATSRPGTRAGGPTLFSEVLDAVELGRVRELPVERVAPAVVPAAEGAAGSLALRDGTGAVPADVRERPQTAVVAADDEQRLAGDLGGEVRPGDATWSSRPTSCHVRAKTRSVLVVEDACVACSTRTAASPRTRAARRTESRGPARVSISPAAFKR